MEIKKVFDNLEEMLCATLTGSMACLGFANVASRYLLHYSISFSQELVLNAFVWVTFLGAAVAFKRGSHIAVAFLVNKFSIPAQKMLILFSGIVCVGLFVLLIGCSIDQVISEFTLATTSDALGIPVYWYTLGIPLFSILIVIRIIQATIKQYRGSGEE